MKNNNSFVLGRLILLTTVIYVSGALLSGFLAYRIIRGAVYQLSDQNLTAILNSRAILVEDYIRLHQEQVACLAENETIVRGIRELSSGYDHLQDDLAEQVPDAESLGQELDDFYRSEFDQIIPESHELGPLKAPKSETGRLAQWVYLFKNPNPYGRKNALRRSPYDSRYEIAHREYHPRIEKLLQAFEYRDIFLVDVQGNLIYTTQKEIDYATNLSDGRYATTGLGQSFRSAMSADPGSVAITDFEAYAPSSLEPAVFLAVPIFDADERIGAVAFQLSPDKLNRVIADPHGLGSTGETYVIGDDLMMRTDSRFYQESTILKRKVETVSAKAIFRGQSGSAIVADYRGVEVLSHYRPLDIEGLNWGIIAEIDQAEVAVPGNRIAWIAIGVLIAVLFCIGVCSIFILRVCVKRPLDQLLDASRKITEGDYSARVHVSSNDEFAALGRSQNEMAQAVQDHIVKLESALTEVKELQGLLPICAACKSIRDDDGYYKTIETYLVGKSKLQFSHTICNDCIPRLYPELENAEQKSWHKT